jgi:sugar lactone lactonase YvrE
MAPEQIEGRKVDGRADIYSLGAVMYHLVTGRPPFEGDDPVTIAYKHVHEAPTPPGKVAGDVPRDWEALILRALAKDPAQRFRSAATMEEAIASLSTEPRAARQAGGLRARIPTPVPRSRASSVVEAQPAVPASPEEGRGSQLVAPPRQSVATKPARASTGRLGLGAYRERLPRSTGRLRAVLVAAAILIFLIAGLAWRTLSASSPSYAFGHPDPTWPRPAPHFGPFRSPEAIATDGQGDILVAETGDLRVLSPTGDPIQVWGSYGTGRGQLELPTSIAVSPHGALFVADGQLNRVEELAAKGRVLRQWNIAPATPIPSGGGCGAQGANYDLWGTTVDRSDHLYVVDGQSDRVQTFSSSGQLLGEWSGRAESGTGTGPAPLCGIAAGVHGDVYIIGGPGYVDHYSAAGELLGRLGSPGGGRGRLLYTTALAADRRGNVYVADSSNIAPTTFSYRVSTSQARIQEFNSQGRLVRTWGSLTQQPALLPRITSLALDEHGNVLAFSLGASVIYKLSSDGRVLAQWNGASQSTPIKLSQPTGIAVDPQGSVYVSEPANGKVVRFSSEGGPVTEFAGPATPGQKFSPEFLAAGANDTIYVAAPFDNRIDQFAASGSFLRFIAETGTNPTQLANPFAVAVDRGGTVYVSDHANDRIVKLSAAGKELASYTLPWQGLYPSGIALDGAGNVYVILQRSTPGAPYGSYPDQVVKLSPDLKLLRAWGGTESGPGQLNMPGGIAVDSRGHILVADSGNNRVVAFSADGRFLSQLRDGFSQPSAVAVDEKGDVYVADTGNNRVVKFLPGS